MVNGNSTGGRVHSYNGEGLDCVATTGSLSAADKNKIALVKYSGWSFENLFSVGTLTGARKTVYDRLVAVMPAPANTPSGGRFPPRFPACFAPCAAKTPRLTTLEDGLVECHLAD